MSKVKFKREQRTVKPIKTFKRGEYVDPKTGELVERYSIEIENKDADFHKLWLWHIAAALELIGNQKIRILSYILENTREDNLFVGTQQMIGEATETSRQTVTLTMNMLKEADIIKMQHSGAYFINPEVIFKGTNNKRLEVLYQYHAPKQKKPKGK